MDRQLVRSASPPPLSLKAGIRIEYSRISETGDSTDARDFFYPKPRSLLSWSPDEQSQLRLRLERTVGQIGFAVTGQHYLV